jgi:hypothetical protein
LNSHPTAIGVRHEENRSRLLSAPAPPDFDYVLRHHTQGGGHLHRRDPVPRLQELPLL